MAAYTAGLVEPTDAVVRAIGRVEDALAVLAAALPPGFGLTDLVLSRRHTTRVRELDATVAEVGARFRAADATGVVTAADGRVGPALAPTYDADLRSRLARDLLDVDPDPDEVAAWWAALTDGDREALLATEHEVLGNLDGLSPQVRYAANARRLDAEVARSRREVERLQDEIGDRGRWDRLTDWVGDINPASESDTERLAWLRDRLANLERMAEPGRQVWMFEPSGDGRVAEVFGDLTGADSVSVVVPGITNDIADVDGVAGNAENLRDRMDSLDPGGSHATVAWLGYDAPDDLVGAAADGAADDGGPALVDAVDEVVRVNPDARHSIAAHSYGSVVAGRAMGADLPVDAVAVVGSPGMGPDDRDDLGSVAVDLYAGEHHGDVVPFAPVHGEDPADDGFGATVFATDVDGHGRYFARDSLSLENLGRIALGLPLRTG